MASMRDRVVDLAALVAAGTAILIGVRALVAPAPSNPFEREDQRVVDFNEMAEAGHRRGAQEALLTIVEFGDYECPACRALAPVLDGFVSENPGDVALVYRHWPLSVHALADDAARAAECAGYDGKFWEYHDALYSAQDLDVGSFKSIAEAVGVSDIVEFEECLGDPSRTPQIAKDIATVEALDAVGTPTVVVNGVYLGSVPRRADLDRLLAEAREALR